MTSQLSSTKHSFSVLLEILPSFDPWAITVSLLLCSSATSSVASFYPLNVGLILGHFCPGLYTFVLGHLIHAEGTKYVFPDDSLRGDDSQTVFLTPTSLLGSRIVHTAAFRRVLYMCKLKISKRSLHFALKRHIS